MTESGALDLAPLHNVSLSNDEKGIHCIQQQSVSKLTRGELEDLFYQLYDENIHIKKRFNSLDNRYKVMSTRVMRMSRDHKCVESANREEDQKQLRQLRQNEAALRAKVSVLRGQLSSHTRLHSAALSKLQRPRSNHCGRGPCSSCGGDDRIELQLDSSRTGSQTRDQNVPSQGCNSSQNASQTLHQGPSDLPQTNAALQDQIATLQERIAVLEKDMKFASEQSRERIAELEGELATHLSHETAENVELIRARRINKQQEAVITSLQQEHQEVLHQLEASKTALAHAARDQDTMCSALERERQRNVDFQHEIVKLTHMCASLRDVQEQLNDLKKENAVLKEHSNKLLQLADSHHGEEDVQQVKAMSINSQDKSVLSEGHLAGETALLNQQLKIAQNEVSSLQKNLFVANEERYRLHQEVSKARKECLDLQKELVKPCEERKELVKELNFVQKECARLEDEISKVKLELHAKQLQLSHSQQELYQASENELKMNKDKTAGVNKLSSNLALYGSLHTRPAPHVPQPSVRLKSQAQSQPVTPKPRIGDACLTLLEQTAIRPSSGSFNGALGSQISLQERFLELCLPTGSPSAASTPVPSVEEPGISKVFGSPVGGSDNNPHRTPTVPEQSSKHTPDHKSPRTFGLADTQWELEKCRELLRVQCNLNSIYKREVASLNNIVKTLTLPPRNESHSVPSSS